MAILEGRWNCADCGKTQIRGRLKVCPSCGNARSPELTPSERPYLPSDAPVVKDESLLDLARAGPDWECDHCYTNNRGNLDECRACGNPRTVEDTEYLSGGRNQTPSGSMSVNLGESGTIAQIKSTTEETSKLQEPSVNSAKFQGFSLGSVNVRYKQAAVLAAVLAIFWIVWLAFFDTDSVMLEITELEWSRQVEVEEYRTLVEDDWRIPAGGREIRSFEAFHHNKSEFSHYETRTREVAEQVPVTTYVSRTCTRDLGNGFFESYECGSNETTYTTEYRTETYTEAVYVDVPVYRTKYEYEIDRWVTDKWETTSSSKTPQRSPYWAEPTLSSNKFRVGDGRRQEYIVTMTDDESNSFEEKLEFSVWQQLQVGQQLIGEINRQGHLLKVEWPE